MSKEHKEIPSYQLIAEQFKTIPIEQRLIYLANIIFDSYDELYNLDVLHRDLDPGRMTLVENYSELIDTYAFRDEGYVWMSLDSAHDLLLVAELIAKKGIPDEHDK